MSGRKGMLHYKVEIKAGSGTSVYWKNMQRMRQWQQCWEFAKQSGSKPGYGCIDREGELSFHKPIGRPLKAERRAKGTGTVARWRMRC